MGEYVDLPRVKTWYEVEGEGDPLVLLHGGMVTNDTWGMQRPALAAKYRVFLPERRGHGHTPDIEGPYHYEDVAGDTIEFLSTVVGGPSHLVGWSDGAIISLLVAIARPDLVRKIVVMGANTVPASALPESAPMLEHMTADSPDLAMFREMYEAASPDGPDHWPVVFDKLIAMYRSEPNIPERDLARIGARTLVVVGDDDMMSLEHTADLYRAIPDAELAVVPGTSHALLMEKPATVNSLILEFLGTDPVPTLIPIRREGTAAIG